MNQSIRNRFGYSLIFNFVRAGVTFFTSIAVARHLGPQQYGVMMFLLSTFIAMRQLLDMGSSTAFYTFLSQRQRSLSFMRPFFIWLAIQLVLPLLVIALFLPNSWMGVVWQGEDKSIILIAFCAVYFQSTLWPFFIQMGEARRLSVFVQGISLVVAIINLILISLFALFDLISIELILGVIALEWACASFAVGMHLGLATIPKGCDSAASVLKDVAKYCLPLIPYSLVGFGYEFADRWLLQNYAGDVQQAYYSVALQFGAVIAIANASIINIFWKEAAEAFELGNKDRLIALYRQLSTGLYLVASIGAGFLIPWAKEILYITLGTAYIDGVYTMMIMLMYPLHQSLGQITGVMAFATGHTPLYSRLGILFMMIGIPITYVFLASKDAAYPGLGLGSFGLAIKMVLLQIISVNLLAYWLSRSIKFKFTWLFQLICIATCLSASFFAQRAALLLFDSTSQIWLAISAAGAIYFCIIFSVLKIAPALLGVTKADIATILGPLKTRFLSFY